MADEPIMTETFNEELDLNSRIDEGAILSRVFIEVQANELGAAKEALNSVIFDKLKKESQIDLLEVNLYDILKDDSRDFFSGVAEIKFLSRDFRGFVNIVMRYAPSAIEIIQPEELTLESDELHSLVSDISEVTQMYSAQIMALMKDPERRKLYQNMLESEEEQEE